ncbi:hypothetical protein IQ07DRAFT_56685 [Pyrenochaeta sp. DS3sAY3a]|nr:hypothetical protein IQ07DRAFT_56685 [Pyrenochaeta sp. DS3sAY3a]
MNIIFRLIIPLRMLIETQADDKLNTQPHKKRHLLAHLSPHLSSSCCIHSDPRSVPRASENQSCQSLPLAAHFRLRNVPHQEVSSCLANNKDQQRYHLGIKNVQCRRQQDIPYATDSRRAITQVVLLRRAQHSSSPSAFAAASLDTALVNLSARPLQSRPS